MVLRYFNILVLLIGISLLEYSCSDLPETCSPNNGYKVIGLDEVVFYETINGSTIWTPIKDQMNYENLEIFITTNKEEVVSVLGSSSVYAETAMVCNWNIDSVKIARDGLDITRHFTVNDLEWSDWYAIENKQFCELSFKPKRDAANDRRSTYSFEVYTNGEQWSIDSEMFNIISN